MIFADPLMADRCAIAPIPGGVLWQILPNCLF